MTEQHAGLDSHQLWTTTVAELVKGQKLVFVEAEMSVEQAADVILPLQYYNYSRYLIMIIIIIGAGEAWHFECARI